MSVPQPAAAAGTAEPSALPGMAPPPAAPPETALAPARQAEPTLPAALGDTQDISPEDQKEILGEIEQVATESRIQVSDEIFSLRPQRKGAVFPIVTNGFFLALLVAGIAAFGRFFGAEERSLIQEQSVFATTEGRLIEELKKESREKLQEKDREINQIQGRLSRLDQERRDLESSMDTRIQERERELRGVLESELAAERERLRRAGVSEADIASRLRTVEAQKSEEYNSRLAAFRAQAEEERRRAEENLRTLQTEYNQSLQSLNRERDQLTQEARKREEELRSQAEARARSLEREKSTIEQQLTRIAEERQKEDLVTSQLNGFYGTIREQLRGARYDQALATLGNIRTYLGEEGIAQLPAVVKRRDVEFFVVDSLTRLVEAQKSRESTDTASLVAQAALVTELRQTAAAADAAAGRRELAEAERLYRRAISLLPDVEKSYAYLTSLRDQSDADRRARLDGLLAQGEAAFVQGQPERALGFYRQSLEFLPADAAARERLLARVQAIGYNQGVAKDRADGTTAAAAPLAQARALLAEARYSEAVEAYVDALSRQPAATQAREAVEGINRAVAQQKQAADAGSAALEQQLTARLAEIEALRQEVAARDARIAEAEKEILQLQAALQDLKDKTVPELNARIASLEQERSRLATEAEERERLERQASAQSEEQRRLGAERDAARVERDRLGAERDAARVERDRLGAERDAARVERDRLTSMIDGLNRELAALKGEIAGLRERGAEPAPVSLTDAASREELQRLLRIEKSFKDLRQAYAQYAATEDQLLKSQGASGLLESKLKLDAFLTSDMMQSAFPGLWNRIKKYDRAFQDVGRDVAIQDLADIVYELTLFDASDARLRQLEKRIQASSTDAPMVELLNELKRLVK